MKTTADLLNYIEEFFEGSERAYIIYQTYVEERDAVGIGIHGFDPIYILDCLKFRDDIKAIAEEAGIARFTGELPLMVGETISKIVMQQDQRRVEVEKVKLRFYLKIMKALDLSPTINFNLVYVGWGP